MSITGNLATMEFAELLQWLAHGRKTGTLVVDNGSIEKRIFFEHGRIIASASNDAQESLGHFLIERGLLDDATLAHALKLQEATGILLGKVLVTLGSLSEADLERTLRLKLEESVYDLFRWPGGDFRFLSGELPEQAMVPLSLDVTTLVLEGLHRYDVWKERQSGETREIERPAITAPPAPPQTAEVAAGELPEPGPTIAAPAAPDETGPLPVFAVEAAPLEPESLEPESPDLAHFEPAPLESGPGGPAPGDAAAGEPAFPEPPVAPPVEPPAGTPAELAADLPDGSPELRGYYQTVPAEQPRRGLALGLASAGLVIAALGAVYFLVLRPAGTPRLVKPTAAFSAALAARPQAGDPSLPTIAPVEGEEELAAPSPGATAEEPPPATARPGGRQAELLAQYEAELESLRRQLAEAQQVAREPAAGERPVAGGASDPDPGGVPDTAAEVVPDRQATTGTAAAEGDAPDVAGRPGTPSAPPAAGEGTGETGAAALLETAVEAPTAVPDPASPGPSSDRPTGEPAAGTPDPAPEDASPAAPAVKPGDLVEQGPGVVPPRIIRRPVPRYPPAARRAAREATVPVRVLVDEQGRVARVEQVGGRVGMGFDRAALDAASQTTWRAATKDGVPVKMWIDVRIEFRP